MLETFKALAEPSRLQIVELLRGGPLPVGAVVERLGIRQPQASKHLQVLNASGLVGVHRDAQRRIYALRTQPLKDLDVWLESYRRLWETQFQRLDQVLAEMQAAEPEAKKERARKKKERKRKS